MNSQQNKASSPVLGRSAVAYRDGALVFPSITGRMESVDVAEWELSAAVELPGGLVWLLAFADRADPEHQDKYCTAAGVAAEVMIVARCYRVFPALDSSVTPAALTWQKIQETAQNGKNEQQHGQ